jgi:uncharacterized membrane-anchored protein YjiN (DUF445 family)
MTTLLLGPADELRRRGLRRMRAIALSLLLLAAVVFLLTLHRDGAWGFVNAAAEAAMVGALADWFAVTALFRHPLGLPVPHTAIIPTRKDALGQSLQEFVSEHFLTADVARDRVASADVARRAGRWLEDEGHSTRVVAEVAAATATGLRSLHQDEVRSLVVGSMLPRLVEEPLSAVAGRLLGEVVRDGAHHGLVDLAVVEAHAWLSANQRTVARVMAARAPWWSPQWLDDKVIDRVHHEAVAWVADVRDNPRHPARAALDDLLTQLGRDLQDDPATMERFEALKASVLTHPQVGDTVISVWESVRTALLAALAEEDGPLRRRAVEALCTLGVRLQRDDELRAKVDARISEAVGWVVETYGAEIASVISTTVNRWDGKEASDRIELHVGRDLQFIRINGTVVGGLVGLVIHAVTLLV